MKTKIRFWKADCNSPKYSKQIKYTTKPWKMFGQQNKHHWKHGLWLSRHLWNFFQSYYDTWALTRQNLSFKPVSSATVTSLKIEISPVASLYMVLFQMRITMVLIRLWGCAGWSAPVLFINTRRQVFSSQGPLGFLRFTPKSTLQNVG